MKNKFRNTFHILLFWAVLAILCGCVGLPSPATAPAPLAELPASLQFPDDIGVETDELAVAGGSLKFSGSATGLDYIKNEVLPIGGEFFEAITFGFTFNQGVDDAVAAILSDLSVLEIPFNPVTVFYEVPGPIGGIFLGNGVKIDFSDYDFFGTGTTLGCTGCTCPTGCDSVCPSQAPIADLRPVCFRIWADRNGDGEFIRLMAGFFEQLSIEDDPGTPENEKNPGVGTYRVRLEDPPSGGDPPFLVTHFGADYNHRDFAKPLDKSTEYFLSVAFAPMVSFPDATISTVKIEQQALPGATSEAQLAKTLRQSVKQEVYSDPEFDSTFRYIARYRTDRNFWSGTFLDSLVEPGMAFAPPPPIDDFTAECAQLSTAIGVDQGTCVDEGIDVSSVPFLDLITTSDPRVNLPTDFPSIPTF